MRSLARQNGDPETGLLDRAGLESALDAELSRAARHELPLSLVLLEVSAKKARLGGEEIPRIAREVVSAILRRVRREDHAARIGPLRFAVLAVETVESEAVAGDLASDVRRALSRSPQNGGAYTVCVGDLSCQFDELSREELLREAERALAASILAVSDRGLPAGARNRSSALPRSGGAAA
jgi:diguanylate cyclase (GGDEF)-like protein